MISQLIVEGRTNLKVTWMTGVGFTVICVNCDSCSETWFDSTWDARDAINAGEFDTHWCVANADL